MSSPRLWRPVAVARLFSVLFASCVWPLLASAATLTGKVADPDGRPIAGAHVILATSIGTVADCPTDDAGVFAADNIGAGRYEIRVLANGLQADPIAIVLNADERRELHIPLHLSALSESIVVSASQIDMPLSRAADTVTVVTAADLQARQIETVADALRLVPGFALARSGGRGALTSLFPRGGSSNYTLVLIDGMRANAFGGGYDLAHLSLANIDRIEIVRGPQSALFGSDALGAVVQIVTRRGGPPHVDGLVEGGSQGTERSTMAATLSRGGWTFGGGAEQTRSSGYTGVAPATGERVTNDDSRLWHLSSTLGWRRPSGPDLVVNAHLGRDERGFPGPFGSNPIGAYAGVDRVSRGINDTRQIGARVSHPWSPRLRQRVEASYSDLSADFTSPFGPSSSGTRRFDGRVQEDVAFTPGVGASAGVELLRERGSSTYVIGAAGQPIPITRLVTGTFVELRLAKSDRFFVTGGLRAEHLARRAVEPDPNGFPPRPPFGDQSITSVNPKVAVSYLLVRPGDSRGSTRLHASAGSGIRPPDVFEIAFTDNPNLKPERSRSIDGGIEQHFGGGAYIVGATAFVNRYDDLLVTTGTALGGASRYHTDNISNARAWGLEITGNARLPHRLTLGANYTLLDTETLSVDGLTTVAPPPFKVGDALIRRPRHQGAIDLTYAAGRVTAFGTISTRSRILDVEPNYGALFGGLFFTPGYAVVNAGASVRLARGVDLYARVMNLMDRAYEETLGFPALRRSGIVGVRVAAGR